MALRETIGNKRKSFKKTRNSDPKIRRNRAKSIINHLSPQQHVAAASELPSGAIPVVEATTLASGRREKKAATGSTSGSRPPFHITNNNSSSTTVPTTDRAVPDTVSVSGGKGKGSKRTPLPVARTKAKPTRFSHPRLDSVLRRLGRAWLSPGDDLYHAVLARSYRGMRFLPREELPRSIHRGFRRCFDDLNDTGLFMYDTVQAGGKRLSRTFVTRTLVGDAGITYKYLGLRLFAHPWNAPSDFRVGPGDKLADTLSDPCLADLFGEVSDECGIGLDVGGTLRGVRELSEWMRIRAEGLLDEEEVSGQEERGSCAFNLTLINRMESVTCKRDLKPDPLFDMGKCSVSWHADSCLEDFSAIGVYHCTEPVPAEPDWGIALRVSQEDDEGGIVDGGSGDANPHDAATSKRKRKSGQVDATTSRSSEERRESVLTPPLLVPLRSGDAYFLLDDFNHFHEHAVVSGRSTLRYSSTHRVATVEGNTFYHVQRRCEEVLAGSAGIVDAGGRRILSKTNPLRQIFDVAQVRAEQSLLTELESEWLNQFWVQGRRHASLHPWWRGPMALMLATWRELERRTAVVVGHLLSLEHGGAEPEPAVVAKAFETVLRALEERRESRSRWISRFSNSVYRSLPPDCVPVVPMLWGREHASSISRNSVGALEGEERDPEVRQGIIEGLPQDMASVILRLRECYKKVFRAACGGEKASSANAIASGAASNWEIFRAAGRRKERNEEGVARPRDVAKKDSGVSRRSPAGVSGAGVVSMSRNKRKGKLKKRRR